MKAAMIRCEKNEQRCPLTGCFTSMIKGVEGFKGQGACEPAGVFTCHCPGDNVVNLAKILQSKGAEVIHLCTCLFSKKTDQGWTLGDGFCDHASDMAERIQKETGLTVVLGTAHLPKGYEPQVFGK